MQAILRLVLGGFVVAVLGLSVGYAAELDFVGGASSGSAPVEAPPVEVLDVHWDLKNPPANSPTVLFAPKVTFGVTDPSADGVFFDVYAILYDGSDAVLGYIGKTEQLGIDPVEVTFNFTLQDIPVVAIERLGITVCYHTDAPSNSLPARACRTL